MKKEKIDEVLGRLYNEFGKLPAAEREQFLLDNADDLTDDDIVAIYNDRELGEGDYNNDYYE
mgnify:CR=1 FL=1